MRIWEFLQHEVSRFWGAIIVGMAIGLSGAYAREFNDGRNPNGKWLRNRLLIFPFLSLAAASVAESTSLSRTQAAFLAAILSLLSFDAVRLITEKFMTKTEDAIDVVLDDIALKMTPKELLPLQKPVPADNSDGDDSPQG